MARLSVTLLGGFQARCGANQTLSLPRKKNRALLAYLAMPVGRIHARDSLIALLWGDLEAERARNNFRQALFALRSALTTTRVQALRVDDDSIALDASVTGVDVMAFERAIADGSPDALETAAGLYRGDFLAGLEINEAPFEEWVVAERERLRNLALRVHVRLVDHHMRAGTCEAALDSALRALTLDPLHEPMHRAVIRLHAEAGRFGSALHQYQTCVELLRRELDTEPDAETRAVYRELLQRPSVKSGGVPEPAGRNPSATRDIPLVGRTRAMDLLRRSVAKTQDGKGHVIAVLGEAGIGKTRLTAELIDEAARGGVRVLLGHSFESEQIISLAPWVDAIRSSGVLIEPDLIGHVGPVWTAELARLFPELGSSPTIVGDSSRRLFEAVTRLMQELASRTPVLVVLEDVHWADDLSLRLVSFLARRASRWRLIVILTAREEEIDPGGPIRRVIEELGGQESLLKLVLQALDRADTEQLVAFLARPRLEPSRVCDLAARVWELSHGNPFVVVEAIRSLEEGRAAEITPGFALPQRVRDTIARRLERLGDLAQRAAAVAAVIGRPFEFAILVGAGGLTDLEAADSLEELVRRRILDARGATFHFCHDRIRQVAYDRLQPFRRRVLHERVVAALRAFHRADLGPHYVVLAYHASCAELWAEAAEFAREAGGHAARRGALGQAVACLEQALDTLGHLAESPATLEQGFDIRLDLRSVLIQLAEPRKILDRLREADAIAERLNDDRRSGRVSAFMTSIHTNLGHLDEALVTGARALELAERLGDLPLRILTTNYLGQLHNARGDYDRVIELARKNVELLPTDWRRESFGNAALAAVYDRVQLSIGLAETGNLREAADCFAEAIRLAEATGHPFTIGLAYGSAKYIHRLTGDWAHARALTERAVEVLRKGSVALLLPYEVSASAWVLAQVGETIAAQDRLREGERLLASLTAKGVVGICGTAYHSLAHASLRLGRLDDARRFADLAIQFSRGFFGFTAHALHLLGDIASHPDRFDAKSAETNYREALALAEPRRMRPLIAHCHFGLGRLYQHTGSGAHADEHFEIATMMYREMQMTYWLEQTERSRLIDLGAD